MDPAQYRPKTGDIPQNPGVYRFWDEQKQVIYVGKAKNLRQRLSSYFADPASLHSRTARMVYTAAAVTWTVVTTEVEALQLEYSWIKRYSPRFNVKYRDDKSYPFLAVTMAEEFPRVQVMRGEKRKGTRYFGPYSHAWAIRETVDLLLRVFPVRTCSMGVFNRAERTGRPCLLGYIDKCSAPCVGRIDAAGHRAHAEGLVSFMAGKTAAVINDLTQQMSDAADKLDYEAAARRRDDIGALQRILEKNSVVLTDGTNADLFALHADDLDASVYGFRIRTGRITGQRGWVVERSGAEPVEDLMQRLLGQFYAEQADLQDAATGAAREASRQARVPQTQNSDDDATALGLPPEILVSVEPAAKHVVEDWLTAQRGSTVTIRKPQRGPKSDLVDTALDNARRALAAHKTKRAADLDSRSAALNDLQQHLDLPQAPLRIESFDISTLHGTHTVGSMVVFEDGLPKKSDYRSFTVSPDNAGSDVAAMQEVLGRRLRRYLAEQDGRDSLDVSGSEDEPETPAKRNSFAYPPALIVVDGGAPQVAVAHKVVDELGMVDVPVVGLAKRLEELWLPGDDYPVVLPRDSASLYLVQAIRDEAHRFAIKHHRSKRSKAMTHSALDGIKGLGPKRIEALLAEFGSTAQMVAAGEDRIAAVKGVGPRLAAQIVAALGESSGVAVNTATGEVTDL